MIKIEIDGREISAEAGSMVIQVADQVGIPIPRFCYHKKLSVAANCRMCLVQVDKSPKPLPACATPIAEGMKIWTTSPQAVEAQRAVMEFLLINHPLDCPICDQGGECELQDVSMQYGNDISRYTEAKRVVEDHNLGPLIATDLTRCIQCTRCVRFGEEISGERELGAVGRGENLKIETFMHQHVNSEVSGNVIDLCPVGALTSKPFRFRARAWELIEHATISPHDCIGSHLSVHVLRQKVMRVVPKDAEEINETWISDRDRFSYQALTHEDRLHNPMLQKQGIWGMASWIEALKYCIAGIKLVIDSYGADQVGVLASPNATSEELFLLQELMRGLGVNNIDHRLRQQDFSGDAQAALFPNLGMPLKDIEKQDVLLLVGTNLHKEQPIIGLKVRKAALNGGKISVINPAGFNFNFDVNVHEVVGADFIYCLAGIAKALLSLTGATGYTNEAKLLAQVTPTASQLQIAQSLLSGNQRAIIFGQLALMHPQAEQLTNLGKLIAKLSNSSCGLLSDGANAAGAWLAGCVPHRLPSGAPAPKPGKNAMEMLEKPLRCYILYGVEVEFDSVLSAKALKNVKQADFVVSFSPFQSANLLDAADLIIPLSPFAENSGSLINCEGKLQNTRAAIEPFGDSRPGWKILRVLGDLAQLPNFKYDNLESVTNTIHDLHRKITSLPEFTYSPLESINFAQVTDLIRIAPVPLYSVDSLTRRAIALQNTTDAIRTPTVQMNLSTANNLRVKHGERARIKSSFGISHLNVEIVHTVPDNCVMIYQGLAETTSIGLPYAVVEVGP